jgi:mono/diheme cytochrome c family protein
MHRRVIGFLACCALTVCGLAVYAACQTQQPQPSPTPTDPSVKRIDPDRSVERCSSLLPDERNSVNGESLTVRASGDVAEFGDHAVSAEQFHRFIDWYYEPRRHPAADTGARQLARSAGWFYAVRQRLDDNDVMVRGSQILTFKRIAESQFSDTKAFRQYLEDVGLTESELTVELCRAARLLNFARAEPGFEVQAREIDALVDQHADDTDNSSQPERLRQRAATYLALKQIDEWYPEQNSPKWSPLERRIEVFPEHIEQKANRRASLTFDQTSYVHEMVAGPSSWRFDYPRQSLGDDTLPSRTLDNWILPADTAVEADVISSDISRTLYVPRLDLRFVAPAVKPLWSYYMLRFDGGAVSASGVSNQSVELHPTIYANYARGLAHLAVHQYEPTSQASEASSKSTDDPLARMYFTPETRALKPGVERTGFSVEVTSRSKFDGALTSIASDTPSGQELYKRRCASCHGIHGKGNSPAFPKLAGAEALNGGWSAGDLIRVTLRGSNAKRFQSSDNESGTFMPGIDKGTTPDEFASIINYITTEWGNDGPRVDRNQVVRVSCATDRGFPPYLPPGTDADEVPHTLQRAESSGTCNPDTLGRLERQRGDAGSSYTPPEQTYANNCASCHGETGRGDGVASGPLEPAPTDFHSPADWSHGRTITDAFIATTRGIPDTSMRGYPELSPNTRWALAIYTVRMLSDDERADTSTHSLTALCRRLTKRRSLYNDPCRAE